MKFRVLGPVEVSDGNRILPLGGFRQRLVLGVRLSTPALGTSFARLGAELAISTDVGQAEIVMAAGAPAGEFAT